MNANPSMKASPATVAARLSNLDAALADAGAAGAELPQETRASLVATVEEAMATRFVVAEGDDVLAARLNEAAQPHHTQALAIARTLAVHDGLTNANPFEHDQLKRAYDSEFRFNQRFLEADITAENAGADYQERLAELAADATVEDPHYVAATETEAKRRAAALTMAKDAGVPNPEHQVGPGSWEARTEHAARDHIAAISDSNMRFAAGTILARGAGVREAEKLTWLAMATAAAEKPSAERVSDPVTGRPMNAHELSVEMGTVGGTGTERTETDREFSRRRGYTEAEINQFEAWVTAYHKEIGQGAKPDYVQEAMHIATGRFEIPAEIKDRVLLEEANLRRYAARILARDIGVENSGALIELGMRVLPAEKSDAEVLLDPTTGRKVSGYDLAEEMGYDEPAPGEFGPTVRAYMARRGYTASEIDERETFEAKFAEAMPRPGSEGQLLSALGVAAGLSKIPGHLVAERIREERARVFNEARTGTEEMRALAGTDREVRNALFYLTAMERYSKTAFGNTSTRNHEGFMAAQLQRVQQQLSKGIQLPEVRVREHCRTQASQLDQATSEVEA